MARHRFAIHMQVSGLDLVEFGSKSAARKFQQATDQFFFDGRRAALFEALIALGMDARTIRWHADHPGERMPCCVNAGIAIPPRPARRPSPRRVQRAP
ncbi:hypothetical protein PQJ75_15690 [Rhodoplanes sp. TEM]|uniref:Uncharacterized protein n=1 Tax=Rhodoplanes tepidamans TaxID=200616 RepID=A0ABT5J505_RHOTP|nr:MULTISPECIES: hypothetical protein [Rhodoplanes]MDC7784399.1 hypothetical protein [Rhodoplanes tepidamans]MDC7985178.1 hypothetical protein [Rhodoplanes sp. TEM]MDQ0354472.1 hypothetical protein [Rhodoplanes tepidamans]